MPGISGAILLTALKPLPKGVELLLSKDSLTRVFIDQEPVRFIYMCLTLPAGGIPRYPGCVRVEFADECRGTQDINHRASVNPYAEII